MNDNFRPRRSSLPYHENRLGRLTPGHHPHPGGAQHHQHYTFAQPRQQARHSSATVRKSGGDRASISPTVRQPEPEKTHWRVLKDAVAASLIRAPTVIDIDRRTSVLEEDHDDEDTAKDDEAAGHWKKKTSEEHYVDMTFVGSIPTGMELLEECHVIYVRPVPASDPVIAGKPHKRVVEILDHNGDRLYLMAGSKVEQNAFLEFTWFDYTGSDILQTTGKWGNACCGGKMKIWFPEEDHEKGRPMGKIKQRCKFRPRYRFVTEERDVYEFQAYPNQWLCFATGSHAPHNFDVIDPEFNDLVGSIYKLNGYVNFGHQLAFGEPAPNFDGCVVQFAGSASELGPQTKAMMICGAFLLSIQHFEGRNCCGYSCCSLTVIILMFLVIFAFGCFGLVSFVFKDIDEDVESKRSGHLKTVQRTDTNGTLTFYNPY